VKPSEKLKKEKEDAWAAEVAARAAAWDAAAAAYDAAYDAARVAYRKKLKEEADEDT